VSEEYSATTSTACRPTSAVIALRALIASLPGSSKPPALIDPNTPVPQTPPTIANSTPTANTTQRAFTTTAPHHENMLLSSSSVGERCLLCHRRSLKSRCQLP
jgi:hypothetical protein